MAKGKDVVDRPSGMEPSRSSRADIDEFLKKAGSVTPAAGRGRLVFALDATMSRQPTWDLACELQAGMFGAAAAVGGLSVQLAYFRGIGESRASPWVADPQRLRDLMVRIQCRGGHTQIAKILQHVRRETERQPVAALAYVGDAMEENVDRLCQLAGEIGLLGVKAFMFHEGRDTVTEKAFREIARITDGAYLPFNASSANELRMLLAAVATYAAGGLRALQDSSDAGARLLLGHMGR